MSNNRGTRATNGEGTIYKTIQKIDRKHNRLDFVCDICKNCDDWSICNYREGTKKCEKCLKCNKCLTKNFCDRFYCREMVGAQITVDGNQVSVASKRTRKETVAEKKKKEADVLCGTYVKKDNKTLYHFCKEVERKKVSSNLIKQSTQNRHNNTFNKLENADFFPKSIQKTTKDDIDNFVNQYTYLSQSELDKIVNIIRAGFEEAMEDDVITYKQNFMRNYKSPLSEKQEKEVVAFELDEFIKLLKYLLTTDKLIKNNKCNYDSRTIRNIIILSFLSLTRIGEIGAIDLDKHINLSKEHIIIERTLTEDENGKVKWEQQLKLVNVRKK